MNSYPSPQYRQEDQNQSGILDALGKIALGAGAGVGLLYGLNPKLRQSARQRIADIIYDPKTVENAEKVRAISKASPETVTTAFRSEKPRGTQVVNLNPSSFKEFSQQADQIAAKSRATQVGNTKQFKEDPYVPASSSEPPSWQNAGNMIGDYGQIYGASRSKETTQAIEQARRQAAVDAYVNTIRSNSDSYQLSVPGINPELIALRSKEGLPSPGELTGIAESRPLSAAPQQGSFALTYNKARGAVAPTNPVVSQAVEAIDTGADQAAMRVSRTVQRDPGENLVEFEQLQDQLEQLGASPVQAADAAVATTEGNIAFTQTDRPLRESSTARFLANERDEIASQLAEQGLLVTPGRIEKELNNRFGSEAYKYGPEYTQLKQNIQLGATYDPELFNNPGKPFVRVAGEEVPTGRVSATKIERTPYTNELIAEDVEIGLRQPTYMKETAERLQEKAANKRDWLGGVRLEEASKNAKLNAELINTNRRYNETLDYSRELTDFLDSKRGTPEQRTRARQRLDDVNYELDRLDVLSEDLNQAVYGGQSGARVRGAEKFTEDYIANLTPPSRLKSGVEEGQRLFFEVDPNTNEPIPGTQELRAEKYAIDTDLKSGGGRLVVEFDPEGQSGQAKDIYGIRQSSSLRDDPKKRPSEPQYTKAEIADEAMRLSSASPEGDVPFAPDYETVIESLGSQPKTEASRRSVLMSEATLRAEREKANRNPRGGQIPGELEILRRSMPEITALDYLGQGPRSRVAGLPPQQRTIPGVTGYNARQRRSQADIEAQQLESYMRNRMIGRSTPLTSEVVIQPKLF